MTEREKEIKHFAHEHPLIFNDSEEIPFCCDACGLHVLSSPSYICTVQSCSFYLHEPCTRLPAKLSHRVWNSVHDLHLLAKPLHENCSCSKCGRICKNFTYHCYKCDQFDLDPLCGYPLDIRIQHISHKEHPMVAIRKESLLLCDMCGREHRGFFFTCHQCNILIHQDCASLPSFLRVGCHPDLFSLMYSSTMSAIYISDSKCIICEKDTSRLFGAYTCTGCYLTAHVHCAVSAKENPDKIHQLPSQDDTFMSSIIRTVLEENTTSESNAGTMLEKYHAAHSLILNNEIAHQSVCSACIWPIAPPYYSCSQSACDFYLHKFCVDLPLVININNVFDDYSRHLVFPRYNDFFSLFFCQFCTQLCNGFGYLLDRPSGPPNIFHLECALAPKVIKHDSHKQHPLIMGGDKWLEEVISCCDKVNPFYYDDYSCTQCGFCIHNRCALLPKTVTHKFDKHPLTLITDSSAQDLGDDHLCEFCEEDITPWYWFYRCIECDHSFHVDCIPSTGQYSRIKFGGTVVLSCHGDHPLTLLRMLSVGSQTCGFCHKIIKGFKDGMALHCAECDFWIHYKCGWESSGATVYSPYQDISSLLRSYSYYKSEFFPHV